MSPVITPVISRQRIQEQVYDLATRINHDYDNQELVIIGVLKGVFIFLADLVRLLKMPVRIDFVHLSSYGQGSTSSGEVLVRKDVEISLKDQHVLIVEDIVDSGLTMAFLLQHLQTRRPESLKICCLIDKTERRTVSVPLDYVGFSIDQGFLVGYGLDYAEQHRHYPDICKIQL
ncbi:hypoxanthine phosphoribosyltransferase [Desulfobacca acetoxidans]|uniref:Hypoxanthine phosphoribosyltransferase n=1 Tax=Desulfobacca acetoxidans (strain ATCC 700848 / DSM 11109 / ASRB2) TaxID=880072 RepID=F2NGE1_DESAR|nr:hypoxanthine phosphoribosyltransferase [Desulfobacca acetoxidans]AEB08554.1 hypoxanthine phosphoribosyltransferase [Desulfobacca acetoxidans DSM 11109]HAY22985.1 hypoxanthine phosphoribosyltransferase [Desulfobacterales bacterium]